MALYNLSNISGGFDTALVGTVTTVPMFTPMFLFFIFMIVTIGGAMNQKRRTGVMDLPMWITMGCLSTLMVAMPMTLITGLIQTEVLVIVVVLTILSGVWFFFDKNKNEV